MVHEFVFSHEIYGEPFTLRMQGKAEEFGDLPILQLWLPLTSISPSRKDPSPSNYSQILNAFWILCHEAKTLSDRGPAESYLLARLLPFHRDLGSRRIVLDSHLSRPRNPRQQHAEVNELDTILTQAELKPLTELEFRDRSADVIAPITMTAEDNQIYAQFCSELFDEARSLLINDRERAVEIILAKWSSWMDGFARRTGHEPKKRILDILSYEARAAFHRCYSAVWDEIILEILHHRLSYPRTTGAFLRFWHLDQVQEANEDPPGVFHMFHGHIFGLHPAGAMFLQTTKGKELMGAWLKLKCPATPRTIEQATEKMFASRDYPNVYGRLLQGLLLAIHVYASRHDEANSNRRGRRKQKP